MHIIAFLVLILHTTLSAACFYGEGALNVTGKWATLLFQILQVTKIKSWHQIMYFLTPTKQTAGSVHNQVVATPAKFQIPFISLFTGPTI